VADLKAIFFDVDFTLIHPGPTFHGEGYRSACARHGIAVDPSRFADAVASASVVLDAVQDAIYAPQIFIDYTSHVIRQMGGEGDRVPQAAREIYEAWADNQHFSLYREVPAVLRQLHDAGLVLGLISNTHRCLTSFQEHFELQDLVSVAVSSSAHGYMKPHPSIFESALRLAGVAAPDAMMVGDSLRQDIEGALRVGMRAVLVCRSGRCPEPSDAVPVIRDLTHLDRYIHGAPILS